MHGSLCQNLKMVLILMLEVGEPNFQVVKSKGLLLQGL